MNFNEYASDRSNTIEQYTHEARVGPCREPFQTFVIDYAGAVMPAAICVVIFQRMAVNVVGNLSKPDNNILNIHAGRLAAWR